MKKAFPYLLLALLAIAALFIKRCRNTRAKKAGTGTVDRNNGLDRRADLLEYTEHAKCRMDCIHITQQQVAHILQAGQVNAGKSETTAKPCPVFVVDGYTSDSVHLRIEFAQCNFKTKVMSCINIDSANNCHCTGVGSKYDHP
jgi:hypothetical protein